MQARKHVHLYTAARCATVAVQMAVIAATKCIIIMLSSALFTTA
jgi:hypothetical protein